MRRKFPYWVAGYGSDQALLEVPEALGEGDVVDVGVDETPDARIEAVHVGYATLAHLIHRGRS